MIRSNKQTRLTLKTIQPNSFQKPILQSVLIFFNSCASVSSFCICCVIEMFLHYCHLLFNLGAISLCLNLAKICDMYTTCTVESNLGILECKFYNCRLNPVVTYYLNLHALQESGCLKGNASPLSIAATYILGGST